MSDIPTDPMSLNDPIRDVADAISEGYAEGFRDGQAEVLPILRDLIAELVGDDGDGHEATPGYSGECQVCNATDRAEARLKGLGDE
jgi:hypothetical protein